MRVGCAAGGSPSIRPVLLTIVLLFLGLGPAASGLRAEIPVAVMYPSPSKFARVFEEVIGGLQDNQKLRIQRIPFDKEESPESLLRRSQGNRLAVVLGHRGYHIAKALQDKMPVVAGAALIQPDGIAGISLSADPEAFFRRLGTLTPPVERVYTVYSEHVNGWLIPVAQRAASKHGVELIAYEAQDMRSAVRLYRQMLDRASGPKDAIWLPLDNIAPDQAVLPLVLEAAWNRNLVVFSNNPAHVQKGVLFGLFPDHRGLGQQLGEMAQKVLLDTDAAPDILPLSQLKLAVNLRTAAHLGIHYTQHQKDEMAVVYSGD